MVPLRLNGTHFAFECCSGSSWWCLLCSLFHCCISFAHNQEQSQLSLPLHSRIRRDFFFLSPSSSKLTFGNMTTCKITEDLRLWSSSPCEIYHPGNIYLAPFWVAGSALVVLAAFFLFWTSVFYDAGRTRNSNAATSSIQAHCSVDRPKPGYAPVDALSLQSLVENQAHHLMPHILHIAFSYAGWEEFMTRHMDQMGELEEISAELERKHGATDEYHAVKNGFKEFFTFCKNREGHVADH